MFFIRYSLVVTNSAIIEQSIAYCSPLGVCAWLVPRDGAKVRATPDPEN